MIWTLAGDSWFFGYRSSGLDYGEKKSSFVAARLLDVDEKVAASMQSNRSGLCAFNSGKFEGL